MVVRWMCRLKGRVLIDKAVGHGGDGWSQFERSRLTR